MIIDEYKSREELLKRFKKTEYGIFLLNIVKKLEQKYLTCYFKTSVFFFEIKKEVMELFKEHIKNNTYISSGLSVESNCIRLSISKNENGKETFYLNASRQKIKFNHDYAIRFEDVYSGVARKFILNGKYNILRLTNRITTVLKVFPFSLKDLAQSHTILKKFFEFYLKILSEENIFIKDILRDMEENSNRIKVPIPFDMLEKAKNKKQLLEMKTKKKLPNSFNKFSLSYSYSLLSLEKYVCENEINKFYKLEEKERDILDKSIKDERMRAKDFLLHYINFFILKSKDDDSFIQIIGDYIYFAKVLKEKISLKFSTEKGLLKKHDRLVLKMTEKESRSRKKIKYEKDNIFLKYLKMPDEYERIDKVPRLTREGKINRNCVATYLNRIEKGKCIIYSTIYQDKRYTIEITYSRKKFNLRQIRGFANSAAPKELVDKIEKLLNKIKN